MSKQRFRVCNRKRKSWVGSGRIVYTEKSLKGRRHLFVFPSRTASQIALNNMFNSDILLPPILCLSHDCAYRHFYKKTCHSPLNHRLTYFIVILKSFKFAIINEWSQTTRTLVKRRASNFSSLNDRRKTIFFGRL